MGIDIKGWLGANVKIGDNISVIMEIQISPAFHSEISVGLDGVGLSVGAIIGDISHDFEIKGGWGLLAVALCEIPAFDYKVALQEGLKIVKGVTV